MFKLWAVGGEWAGVARRAPVQTRRGPSQCRIETAEWAEAEWTAKAIGDGLTTKDVSNLALRMQS